MPLPTLTRKTSTYPITVADSGAVDAFGRLRVSEPTTLFDSKLVGIDDAPLYWEEVAEAGDDVVASTPTASKPYVDFSYTADSPVAANTYTRQSIRRFVYQPGKSQMVMMTGVLDLSSPGGLTGVERRVGLFDDDNGAFFEDNAGTVGVTVRSNDSGTPTDTTVTQANWDDPMDGGGASKLTADWTKAQIFVIDFQWLSIGRVRFGLQIGGVLYYVHEVGQANTAAIPWASTPNLPLRYQMITTGDSDANASMRCICSTVISEGGSQPTGQVRHYSSIAYGPIDMSGGSVDTWYVVCGIRPQTGYGGVDVELLKASIFLSSNSDEVEWAIAYGNPTLSGTPTWDAVTNSNIETFNDDGDLVAISGTYQLIDGGFVAKGTAASSASEGATGIGAVNSLRPGIDQSGNKYGYFLIAREISGTASATVEGSMTWRETI